MSVPDQPGPRLPIEAAPSPTTSISPTTSDRIHMASGDIPETFPLHTPVLSTYRQCNDFVDPSNIGSRLSASKPLRYRGKGLGIVMPWHLDRGGLLVIIDLWAGFSGTVHAALALGFRCVGLAAECDEHARAVAATCFPELVHIDSVEAIRGEMLRPLLLRRTVNCILIGGGSPCQGNSSLNQHARGVADLRTQQVRQLSRISREIKAVTQEVCSSPRSIISWIENVVGDQEVTGFYSKEVGSNPLLIQAEFFSG